jgi:hypothetical protein
MDEDHASPPPTDLDAGRLAGLLADGDRRTAFAAVQLGATTLEAVATAGSMSPDRAAKALASLGAAGVVVAGDSGLEVAGGVFAAAARAARERPPSDEHAEQPQSVRKVLSAFVRDGRLLQIPTVRAKRLVVLDWLAQDFEPGRRYSESMVNLILGRRHADTAALRRYLVDEGMLARAEGEYWRVGGTVDVEPTGAAPS